MSARLFDVCPEPPPQPAMSRTQRLTVRRREMLAAGKHPLRGDPLTDVEGATCGNCKHFYEHGRSRTYFKCLLYRSEMTHGEATDLRRSWPGCIRWEAQ